ncbi:MAG TPA: universal stress protein [Nevskiaceae bacterium]|nr:universal stress protein [Nevskiaceae bacterium]
MPRARRIMVLVDRRSRGGGALRRAVQLARTGSAELHLCLVEPAAGARSALQRNVLVLARSAQRQEGHDWLLDLADEVKMLAGPVHTHLVLDQPLHLRLLERIDTLRPDLLVMSLHYQPQLKRSLLTPLAWTLLRQAPCDLLLAGRALGDALARVIAVVDTAHVDAHHSELNRHTLALARSLADQSGAELHLVQAGAQVVAPDSLPALAAEARHLHELQKRRFAQFAEENQVPSRLRHLLAGDPATALSRFASKPASDLVMLGVSGEPGEQPLPEYLIGQLRCDVWVVRAPASMTARPAAPAIQPPDELMSLN